MSLLDLVFPVDCAGCGARGRMACLACRAELDGAASLAWPRPSPAGLPTPWAVVDYAGPSRDLLLAYKEREAVGLARVLAPALATGLVAAARPAGRAARAVVVVPVPSTRRAVRERGDDVVLTLGRIATATARRRGQPAVLVPALVHTRSVADSAGLGAQARARNLAGAFVVRRSAARRLRGSQVVIVDDLITTGASLAEAARALRAQGATVIGAATIAATQRRPPSAGFLTAYR